MLEGAMPHVGLELNHWAILRIPHRLATFGRRMHTL